MEYSQIMLWLHTTIFIPNEWLVEASQEEVQNKAYGAGIFSINHVTIRLRVAKVTPKKTGQFVVFWHKDSQNNNQAYAYDGAPDLTMIVVTSPQNKKSAFLFPKEVLWQKGILRTASQKGKMAMRVYPPWDEPISQQALLTKKWQSLYYVEQEELEQRLTTFYEMNEKN